jgi:hypothetical protein
MIWGQERAAVAVLAMARGRGSGFERPVGVTRAVDGLERDRMATALLR